VPHTGITKRLLDALIRLKLAAEEMEEIDSPEPDLSESELRTRHEDIHRDLREAIEEATHVLADAMEPYEPHTGK
jgi:hypothetical protein